METKRKIFGQDPDLLIAVFANVLSWLISTFFPSLLPKLLPPCDSEETGCIDDQINTKCVSIGRPGGLEQLRVVHLKAGLATIGYNVKHFHPPPFAPLEDSANPVPSDCIVLQNKYFSVNYADCTIRWGLYESAKQFVGWPIVPGFDVAGKIEKAPPGSSFCDGDMVFGCTLFGAYSNRVLIPDQQLRKIPKGWETSQAAAMPAVSLTALYALRLAGFHPMCAGQNRSILVHSAAGGVGSMLIQMAKILNLGPIVGVVGNSTKVAEAAALGCDHVIDKSKEDLWAMAKHYQPGGYASIMDANGVSTLSQSYDHLAPTGRLIVFGFHSNLPLGKAMLSPMEWIKMAFKLNKMPKFDPMDLTVSNKSVLGFNLSFFANEVALVGEMFDAIVEWMERGKLRCPKVMLYDVDDIGQAHELIQSGKSVGKIVIRF